MSLFPVIIASSISFISHLHTTVLLLLLTLQLPLLLLLLLQDMLITLLGQFCNLCLWQSQAEVSMISFLVVTLFVYFLWYSQHFNNCKCFRHWGFVVSWSEIRWNRFGEETFNLFLRILVYSLTRNVLFPRIKSSMSLNETSQFQKCTVKSLKTTSSIGRNENSYAIQIFETLKRLICSFFPLGIFHGVNVKMRKTVWLISH